MEITFNLYQTQQIRDTLELIKKIIDKYNCADFEYTFKEKPQGEWRFES